MGRTPMPLVRPDKPVDREAEGLSALRSLYVNDELPLADYEDRVARVLAGDYGVTPPLNPSNRSTG